MSLSSDVSCPGSRALAEAPPADCDVLVVGGGINGAGIVRDLAGRGWRVVLVEQHDLAAHTSSSSTKLIHGGLRYLEYREFSLVRKALQEREVLLASAPHIMKPLRFVMPHDEAMRPAWLIRLGLFLYDHLAHREVLPGSAGLRLADSPLGEPLHERFKRGFVYSDGWVDDARLVLLCAQDARARGATILTRTRCLGARRGASPAEGWQVRLQGPGGSAPATVRARALVNAAGPWAEQFATQLARPARGERLTRHSLRLVKGSHIVVPRCFAHDHAYIFQAPDGRIVFAIPYEERFTLIGTTDVEVDRLPGQACIEADEVSYLCAQASRYFKAAITPEQVVWSYAGIRPLLDDASASASAVTRDYVLETHADGAPFMTVWGGKITTFRKLAEEAASELSRMLGRPGQPWTHGALLPGGDLSGWIGAQVRRPDEALARFTQVLRQRHPWLPEALARRWARTYGADVAQVLGQARSLGDLGPEIAPGLHEAELHHLVRLEWAREADDVLWRRTKLGLHLTAGERQAVQGWMRRAVPRPQGATGDDAVADLPGADSLAHSRTPIAASSSKVGRA